MAKILVVDDNETLREGMAYTIRKMGHQVETASGGMEALSKFVPEQTDFVVTDLKMDHMDGIALLKECRERDPDILVMVVTAFGTIEVAVNAMKEGAFDFITKPFSMELLQAKVQKALDVRFGQRQQQRLLAENQVLRDELEAPYKEQTIVGQGPAMQRVFHLLKKVAASDSTVHIYGESGTGKELIARAIHKQSPRCNGPFIKINCSALTETLLESELFGHEKGAFTNAHRKKLGRFELADQGTIFLDEIGDISPLVQVKLLRVLQERTFERVGGEQPIHVDVRILSATNKDLQQEVDAQRFREDLFYRLHILPLNLPPLRERIEDIEPLVMFFLNKLRTRTLHTVQHVSKESIDLLSVYRWPGNVRELENVLEQTLVFAETETLTPEDFPAHIQHKANGPSAPHTESFALGEQTLPQYLHDLEKALILKAYQQCNHVKTKTARLLGIKPSTLYYKLANYGIENKVSE